MKPSFTLNFTDDSIQLLHRTGKGWVPVGETPFAADDLEDALDYMRKTALGLEPGGFSTQLVIPNSQIRYLELEAPGPEADVKRGQILTALEGKTPYAAEDLVFDWSGKGKMVRVAVLARETLQEAEGFATAHKFNPVGFTAIPESGTFTGAPWFGETQEASALLATGETVERDRGAIVILSRDLPRDLPKAAAKPDPHPELAFEPAPAFDEPAVEDPPAVVAAPLAEPAADAAVAFVAEPAVEPVPEAAPLDVAPINTAQPVDAADLTVAVAPALPPLADALPPPVFAAPADIAPVPDEEAPFTHIADNPAFPEDEDGPDAIPEEPAPRAAGKPGMLTPEVPGLDDDLPPAPSAAAMVAFASRRGADVLGRVPALGSASRPDPAALARAARGKPVEDLPPMPRPPQAPARPAADGAGGVRGGVARGFGSLVSTPALSGTRKAKVKPGPLPPPPVKPLPQSAQAVSGAGEAAKTLTKPGGTFGNRAANRPKSRAVLFLTLVAVLLLCLALIAAWSSYYLAGRTADPAATAVATASPTPDAAADIPAIEDEMAADGQDDPTATADAPVDVAAVDTAADPAPDAAPAGDIPSVQPLAENQDEIFLTTSESPPPALDALSLPPPETESDALPAPQMPPPPFGTVYAFDENGLLIPTPEGILSPEGVLLIAGKPPVVPPSRSDVATAAAAAALVATAPATTADPASPLVEALPVGETAPADPVAVEPATQPAVQPNPDLADRRPKPRPEGLAPNPDDAALTVEPATSFTSLRPRSRPTTVLAAGERARLETESASLVAAPAEPAPIPEAPNDAEVQLAAAAAAEAANPSVVAISRRPAARPKDFNRAVEAAVAAAIRAPTPKAEPEPEPAPKKAAAKAPAPAPDLKPEEQSEIDQPEVAATSMPKVPTKASVAKQATYANAMNLSKINLIGVYGTPSKRYALIRQANGKYKKVWVGDKIDGGKVQAITDNEVRYQKGGRLIALKMPKG